MSASRITVAAGTILALIILVWHIWSPVFDGGYPHYTATFYALLTLAWLALFVMIGGLCRIMLCR